MCKRKLYPVGHPECLVGPQLVGKSVDDIVGLIRCEIIPPKNLYLPLLPAKINGKLIFTLCRTCAESTQQDPCRHTNRQRALTGTWVSLEVQKAISLGYRIVRLHEVWHYKETTQYDQESNSGGLFSGYMNAFIKTKMEASGFPQQVVTEEEKDSFIQHIKDVEGIELEKENIEKNPGKRQVAKACLNNIWGKFAQRSNMYQAKYVRNPHEFFQLLTSDSVEVHECELITDDCVYLTYKQADGFERPPPNTNAVIASFVTCHARLVLYSYMEKLGSRTIYCDTDSLVYEAPSGEYEIELGEQIGGMTDELGGEYIVEFVSNGPKSYAYRTNGGKVVMKCKGFTLDKITSDQLTFDVMKEMVTTEEDLEVVIEEAHKIRRQVKRARIWDQPLKKVYRRRFDKRVRLENHDTLPYGYARV